MDEIQDKLAAWAKLYQECEKLENDLRCATTEEERQAIEAQLAALKSNANMALKSASDALHQSGGAEAPS